ncbi:MAG: chorismate-binding protein [Bacteroidetes bacterium]|nr:chorismate-binding protein [Bacteroidota bacterium]
MTSKAIDNQSYNLDVIQQKCFKKQIPFVSFKLPGDEKITTFIQKDRKLHIINSYSELEKQQGFVFSPFQNSEKSPSFIIKPDIKFEGRFINEVLISFSELELKVNFTSDSIQSTSAKEYKQNVAMAVDTISNSKMSKIVISRVLEKKIKNDFNPFKFYRTLCEKYANAFVYLIFHPRVGMWTGASPEVLVNVNKEKIHAVALAGTQKLDGKDISEIKWGNKEIIEQKIVADFVYDCIQKNDTKEIIRHQAESFGAGNLVHIITNFSAIAGANFSLGALVKNLHPTPSVSGEPKKDSIEFINANEKHNREYYCGFMGSINDNETSNLFVNLRCMKICNNSLALYVGAGITIDSEPEKEWIETGEKAKTLLSVIDF